MKRVGFFIGLAIVSFMFFLALVESRPIDAFEEKLWDLRFKLRGPITPPDNIVILSIDEKSIERIGRWPWRREKIAELINRISSSNPKVIALDLIFSETSDTDKALEQTLRKLDNVILPIAFTFDEVEHPPSNSYSHDLITRHSFAVVRVDNEKAFIDINQPFKASGVLIPIDAFSSLTELGMINTRTDDDGTLRFEILAIEYLGNLYPSFTLKIAQRALDLDKGSLSYTVGKSVQLADREIPTDSLGQTPVFYYGPEGTLPTYSIIDVLDGRIPESKLSEKIVLIGASALGLADLKITPFSVGMPGVEKHGHIVASLLERRTLQKSPYALDLSLVVVIGLLLSLGLLRVKAITGILISLLTLASFMTAGHFLFLNNGIMINMAYTATEIILLYVGITAYRYTSEERQAKKIKQMFSSYVTERVMNELIKDPNMAKLGGARREITILFSDIRGFTSFSESRAPEAVVTQLNEYLGAMTEIVFKHEGTLDKFIGDGIMAFWGAPLKQENHVELALKCALDMVGRLSELQKQRKLEGKLPSFSIGIGLNTGDVIVGNIGIEGKKIDYTVIGDHVNLASRVESLTRSYDADILLTEYTHKYAKDLLEFSSSGIIENPHSEAGGKSEIGSSRFEQVDRVKVKGKKQRVTIYKLLWRDPDQGWVSRVKN